MQLLESIRLKDLQKKFQNDILKQQFTKSASLPWIKAGQLVPKDRLAVYQHGYLLRLLEVMTFDFPLTQKYLGKKKFEACSTEYILKHPSKFRSVNFFGENFPHFIKFSKWGKNNLLLQDLVEREWHCANLYFFKDVEFKIHEKLSLLNSDKMLSLCLKVNPALSFMKSRYDLSKKSFKTIKINKENLYFLIYRKKFDCVVEKVSPQEWTALQMLDNGKNLGQVLDGLYRRFKFKNLDLWQGWFLKWVQNGILYDVTV